MVSGAPLDAPGLDDTRIRYHSAAGTGPVFLRNFLIGRTWAVGIHTNAALDEFDVHKIMFFAHRYIRRLACFLEMIITLLEAPPETIPFIAAVFFHVLISHSKRIGMNLKRLLAAGKGLPCERVDLLDQSVGHCITTRRLAIAVDHQIFATAPMGTVIGVGKTQIEGQVKFGLGI